MGNEYTVAYDLRRNWIKVSKWVPKVLAKIKIFDTHKISNWNKPAPTGLILAFHEER